MKIDTLITKYENKISKYESEIANIKKQLKEAQDKLSLLRELQIEAVLDSLSDLSTFSNAQSALLPTINTSFISSWDVSTSNGLMPDAIKAVNFNDLNLSTLKSAPINL